jgi:hypothetical protein
MVDGVVFEHDAHESNNIANVPNGATFENVKFSLIEPSSNAYYHGFGYGNIRETTSEHNKSPIIMKNCEIE